MNRECLKDFFDRPCLRMKELCEIISDDFNSILGAAYQISLLIISDKIKVFMGDKDHIESFIIKYESLFSKPIPLDDYIAYNEQPESDSYDIVLGVAHKQYSELLDIYNYICRDLHISPKELYDALYSLRVPDGSASNEEKKDLVGGPEGNPAIPTCDILKRYLTGKEIFEAGICTPIELGEMCWAGTITAWDETGAAQYSSQEQWEEMKCGCHSWQVIPFPFALEEYAKENGGPGLAIASEYKADLSRMLFEVDEVKKVFSVSPPAGRTPPLTGKPAHELQNTTSTGSNKDMKRIEATRRACETIREEIERGKHGFRVKGEYKTNRAHFNKSVQNLLGREKVHRDTLREEWSKLPENIKHSGRVPDQ